MSSSAGDASQVGDRLGIKPGMVVQELGWDDDVDDAVRVGIEDTIDSDLVDGDHGDVVDAVVLWWRDSDGDLVDARLQMSAKTREPLSALPLDHRRRKVCDACSPDARAVARRDCPTDEPTP